MAISMEERLTFLKQRPMFAGISDDTIRAIADRMDEYSLPPKKNLYTHGDKGSVFYIIYRGSVRIWAYDEEEQERQFGVLETGDVLGMEALLTGRPRATTATTLEETTFLVLHSQDFEHMVDQYETIDEYLTILMETRREARQLQFPWLHQSEIVQIIARRHPVQLIKNLV